MKWFCEDRGNGAAASRSKKLVAFLTAAIVAAAFSAAVAEPRGEITVSAAMSLKNCLQEFAKVLEARHSGVKIRLNFGASGDLMRQIEGGAPVSLFASASPKEMDELDGSGVIVPGSRVDFASNSLVVIVPRNAPKRISSLEDLASQKVSRVAVGNFRTSPAGRYAEEAFKSYGILPALKAKLIFAENVRQVLDYVARGEVDAGIVYATDARLRADEVEIAARADENSHHRITYSLAKIRRAPGEEIADDFIRFAISAEGQKILLKYGFTAIKGR